MSTATELLRRALEVLEEMDAGLESEFGTPFSTWRPPLIIKDIRAFLSTTSDDAEEPVKWNDITDKELRELHEEDQFGLFCDADEFIDISRAVIAKFKYRNLHPPKPAEPAARKPIGYAQKVIEALYENGDPVSIDAAELLERLTENTEPEVEPVAWQDLTDEEIDDCKPVGGIQPLNDGYKVDGLWMYDFAEAVQEAVQEKNHPPNPAEPEAEPVAYRHLMDDGWEYYDAPTGDDCDGCEPLYSRPPKPGEMESKYYCARSHPHEEMSKECELRTQIAYLQNALVDLKPAEPAARKPMTEKEEEEAFNSASKYAAWLETENRMLREARKPMTREEIIQGVTVDTSDDFHAGYWAGVRFAEKHHGIGGDDERKTI